MLFNKHLTNALIGTALVAVSIPALISCDAVYDDLEPCQMGVELRFVYDYNMEFANAFPSQVDCLSLLIYDAEGNYISTETVTDRSLLGDEDWRMRVDLPEGQYTFIAYGGLACDDSSFSYVSVPEEGSPLTELVVDLKSDMLTSPLGKDLHPLFYGRAEFTIEHNALEYTRGTIKMMKDTNNLRILLQNMDGSPVNPDDFTFAITDNNTSFSWNNDLLPAPTIKYNPWAVGTVDTSGRADTDTDTDDSGITPANLAYAEFSTSRFVTNSSARLVITRNDNQQTVLSIPLVNYLLLLRSEQFAYMSSQEFLDRESRWNVIFFLDAAGGWYEVSIVINGWIIRLNNTEL